MAEFVGFDGTLVSCFYFYLVLPAVQVQICSAKWGGRFKRIIDQYADDPDQFILRHSALQLPGCHLDYELLLILLCFRDLAVHKSGYNAQVDLEQITNGLCKGIKKVGYITSQLQKI